MWLGGTRPTITLPSAAPNRTRRRSFLAFFFLDFCPSATTLESVTCPSDPEGVCIAVLLVQMAGNQMPLVLLLQDRLLMLADIHHIRTARIESARWRRIQKIRRLSGYGAQADPLTFDAGECFDEPLGVRVERILEDRDGFAILYNLTRVHYRDLLTCLCYD